MHVLRAFPTRDDAPNVGATLMARRWPPICGSAMVDRTLASVQVGLRRVPMRLATSLHSVQFEPRDFADVHVGGQSLLPLTTPLVGVQRIAFVAGTTVPDALGRFLAEFWSLSLDQQSQVDCIEFVDGALAAAAASTPLAAAGSTGPRSIVPAHRVLQPFCSAVELVEERAGPNGSVQSRVCHSALFVGGGWFLGKLGLMRVYPLATLDEMICAYPEAVGVRGRHAGDRLAPGPADTLSRVEAYLSEARYARAHVHVLDVQPPSSRSAD